MKKYVTIALFIFWAVVVAILVAGLLFYQKADRPAGPSSGQTGTTTDQTGNRIVLNEAQLGMHNTTESCWLLIAGKIYNVTNYINLHPGGAGAMTSYCGADATNAFTTQGGQGSHSGFASNLLVNYYLGNLGQPVSQTVAQSAPANDPTTTPNNNQREDEDDDREEFDD